MQSLSPGYSPIYLTTLNADKRTRKSHNYGTRRHRLLLQLCSGLFFVAKLSKHCRKFVNFNFYCQADRASWSKTVPAPERCGCWLHFPIAGLSKLWQSRQWNKTVPHGCQFSNCRKFVASFAGPSKGDSASTGRRFSAIKLDLFSSH